MPNFRHAYTIYHHWDFFIRRGTLMNGTFHMREGWFICLGPVRFWIIPHE